MQFLDTSATALMRWILVGAVCFFATVAFPNDASAAKFVQPGKFNWGTIAPNKSLNLNHGYSVEFHADWKKKQMFARTTVRSREGFAEYSTPVSRRKYDRIAAHYADLGRTNLRFKPVSQKRIKVKAKRIDNRCGAGVRAKGYAQRGHLRGDTSFRGEDGYVRVAKHFKKVSARRVLLKMPKCAFKEPRPEPVTGRGAEFHIGNTSVSLFGRSHDQVTSTRNVSLMALEQVGKTEIRRVVTTGVSVRLEIPDYPVLDTAVVNGKSRGVHGQAVFVRQNDGSMLGTGDLAVDLIGRPGVSLTAAGMNMRLELFGFDSSPAGLGETPPAA